MLRRFDRDRFLSLCRFLWQRFIADKCFETAGALSYTTLVSLVPLLVATFAIFAAFPVFQPSRDLLVDFVFRNFLPQTGAAVQAAMLGFAANASKLTGISILVMLASALSMMVSIEDRLNRIWRVHQARSWTSRILLYWAALTLGPILVVGGVAVTSYLTALPLLHGAAHQVGGAARGLLGVLPFLATFLGLGLMYALVPNRRVSLREAGFGALLGALLFEVARWGFGQFVQHAQTYQQIYGVLATIPIFLLWVYLSWVIVILAASIAAASSQYEYRTPRSQLPAGAEFLGLMVVLGHFVAAQRRGEALDPAGLRARETWLASPLIADYFDDLARADLIQRGESGGWLLARSLDSTDLLRVYRQVGYRLPLAPREEVAALGLTLPEALLAMLDELAGALCENLAQPLARIYPVPAAAEESPA